jgi:hypothetical protein
LDSIVEEQLKGILPGVPNRCSRDYLKLYVEQFKKNFSSQMKIRQAELDKSKQKLERRIEANDRISWAFETLDTAISGLEGEMDGLKNKFLRSARLARGFQIIDTSISAFSLWTAPYCGGVAIVPSSHSKLEVPEEEPEIDSNEGDDSETGTGSGAFTIWTAEHIGIELNDSSSGVQGEESDDEEADASVVVSLPTATEEPSEAAAANEEAVASSSDESGAEKKAGDSSEAQEAESADPVPTPVRVVPNPTDQQS